MRPRADGEGRLARFAPGDDPATKLLGRRTAEALRLTSEKPRARASLPDPSGVSRPAVRAQRAATGGVRRSEPGSAEGNDRELSARAFSCRPRCRQGVCKLHKDSRTPALTAHPVSAGARLFGRLFTKFCLLRVASAGDFPKQFVFCFAILSIILARVVE